MTPRTGKGERRRPRSKRRVTAPHSMVWGSCLAADPPLITSDGSNFVDNNFSTHNNNPFDDLDRNPEPVEISADLVGPLPQRRGFKYLLVIVDNFTTYSEVVPIASKEASVVATALLFASFSNRRDGWKTTPAVIEIRIPR